MRGERNEICKRGQHVDEAYTICEGKQGVQARLSNGLHDALQEVVGNDESLPDALCCPV